MATTTMAVGAAILRGGGAARVQMLLSSFSSTAFGRTSLLLPLHMTTTTTTTTSKILKFQPRHRRGSLSFCTSPIANAEITNTSATESSSSSSAAAAAATDKDKEKNLDNVEIRDAAHMLDIRVGRIVKAWRHEEADSLYVEEVDVGEAEPRIICSGLVKYIPMDVLQDKRVVVLANLKPRNMRGVKSSGMLLAASDASHENVELLEPPAGSLPGERIWFGSQEDKENQPAPATPNQIQKKKIWELVQPHLKTDASAIAVLGEHLMQTSAGVVKCRSLKNANIS